MCFGSSFSLSMAFFPETDGSSEGHSKHSKTWLRAVVIGFWKGWERHLPLVEFSYNNSYHASIKAAPFEALYGRCADTYFVGDVGDVHLQTEK
ncbi:putative reverse transcriptase domain-containing protein [Tanacetum coccineum]